MGCPRRGALLADPVRNLCGKYERKWSVSPSSPTLGLRARKRRATENAIELSAVDLALELGIENVTVEAICERADVSRSTFFNYFAGRDYAIVGRAIDVLQGPEADAVLASAPGDLPRGIYRLIFASIGHQHVNTDVARKRIQLSIEQPAARRLSSTSMLESSDGLIAAAVAWLDAHPEHARLGSHAYEASISASIAHAAIFAKMLDWTSEEGDISTDDEPLNEALAAIRTLLAKQ